MRKIINSFEGYQAEIINYVPDHVKIRGIRPCADGKEAWNEFLQKHEKFTSFLKNECGLSMPIVSDITGNDFDYYIVGSDQVWNPIFKNGHQYFLPDLDADAVKIAYAASTGIDKVSIKSYKGIFEKYLTTFKAISLRESECLNFIEEASGKKCEWVSDPTQMLEREDYEKLLKKYPANTFEKPYVFFFWLGIRDINWGLELANSIAGKYHISICHNVYPERPYMFAADSRYMGYGCVEEFLESVRSADFVVTNSYHATLFSLRFEKPFYAFIVKDRGGSRIPDLMRYLELEDRIVQGCISPEEINRDMDYVRINKKLKERKEFSLKFLKRALDIDAAEG